MKVNIKSILIALLILVFFGLLYAFLSSSPEMVSDSRLRVEEPPLQTSKQPLVAVNTEELDEAMVDDVQTVVPEQTIGIDRSSIISPTVVIGEQVPEEQVSSDVIGDLATAPEEVLDGQSYEEEPALDEVTHLGGAVSHDKESSISPEPIVVIDTALNTDETQVSEPIDESLSTLSTTDVSVIPEADDFLDLNLVETKPVEMVLVEGDDLILDDVNEELSKFDSLIKENTSDVVEDVQSSVELSEEVATDVVDSEAETVVALIEIPEADQALMTGHDEMSLEYQSTMEKLLLVKQQMTEADAENKRLKEKFSSVVDQNRELAILIRDIDVKIKSLSAAN